MTNQDFIKEVHQYIDGRYKLFEEYQQIVRSILLEFDRICKNADITYVLAFGNAIGAVRDHDQLPWDYDVDLLVPYDEKNKLVEVLKIDLSDDFYYVYNDNTANYPAICLRVGKKGYTWLALHVDVFFYTGAPDDEKERVKIIKKIIKLRSANRAKNYPHHNLLVDKNSVKTKLLNMYRKIRFITYKKDELFIYMDKIGKRYPVATSNYIVTFGGIKVKSFRKELFVPIMQEVGNSKLPIPSGYEEYLSAIYRDYKLYLPINKRFEEFYKMCNLVELRQSIYEQQSGK